ncbi:MAG: inorganic phosphate transporter [Ignavibacteriaceae bacterium]|nr:inorganic phosphate transporter [Ignavibacteriaceae bacterium]
MEIFVVVLIVFALLAISDLIFGVANDAVNFLNSSIGSKVAPKRTILIIASFGVIAGCLFSGGMMEVARKGIFNPQMFTFYEVIAIFMAAMFADILILDLYNTFGLPTSTTVSLVFGLVGGSTAMAIIKLLSAGQSFDDFGNYINAASALKIISAIFISIVISFFVSLIIQYIVRMIFTFDYKAKLKRYGGMFAGVALTAISYFIVVKGLKGSVFSTTELGKWITHNMGTFLLYSVLFWFVIFQILVMTTKINILKPIVLVGTFSLALAFAANDLVNFIGVPYAAFSAYEIAVSSENPLGQMMGGLNNPFQANLFILIGAGLIMVGTLWLNKKASTVTKTEVGLASQASKKEKFKKSFLSKAVVDMWSFFLNIILVITPQFIKDKVNSRFDKSKFTPEVSEDHKPAAFDLLRAAVNLFIAASLISFGTAYKLPLSTTFVTFIVAMGTSLSDRAWGKENAEKRVNGVLTVIGSWFMTAVFAFGMAFIFAFAVFYGGYVAIAGLVLLAIFLIIKSHVYHAKKQKKDGEKSSSLLKLEDTH